jgi:HEAT repeat protein
MLFWAAILVLAVQQGPSENKQECKAALDQFRAGIRQSAEAARISAIETLSKHICPEAIAALAPHLAEDSERVRIATAKALGGMDHPKSLEVLVAVLPSSESTRTIFDAVVKALQTLDREAGAEALNTLLSKYHEKGMIDEVHAVIPALGSLGSQTSVDPLLQLLEHAENEGKAGRAGKLRSAGNPKLLQLEAPIKAALQVITGGTEPNYHKWKEWWGANRERLFASAVVVYRCKTTGKRWEQKAGEPQACPNHDKPEKDGEVVKTRLHSRT